MTPTRRFEVLATLVVLGLATMIAGVIRFGAPRPLTVVAANPGDGADGVALASQLVVTFSRPVDERSVAAGFTIDPATAGLVSAAGRRAAFTPRDGLRADTTYTLSVGAGVQDRAGGSLVRPATLRFRTRSQRLVVLSADGRLLRVTLAGATEELAGPGVGIFAVSDTGDVAHVDPAAGTLVVESPGTRARRHIPLPRRPARFPGYGSASAVEVRALAWAPGGGALAFLGATPDGANRLYAVRLAEPAPVPQTLGAAPDLTPRRSSPVPPVLAKALGEVVYGRDTLTFTPDGRGVIVRDRTWEFVVLGLDEHRRGVFGPFLAVGNVSPSGEMVAFVDLDPDDPLARRQVVAYERAGRLRGVSSPERDSHSPRFAHRSDRVVFATGRPVGPSLERDYRLETVDLTDGARRQVTSPPPGQSDDAPRWSLDDAWISFRRGPVEAPERGEVWVVPAVGGDPRRLPIAATDARWSP